jgi:phosphatidylinositol alpha-1,6-mannosyltransferase
MRTGDRVPDSFHLLITHDFPPHNPGGMTSYYQGLVEHFPKKRMLVLTKKKPSAYPSVPNVYYELSDGYIINLVRSIITGLKLIKKYKISLIHCGNASKYRYAAWILKKLTGTPFLLYFHGNDLMRLAHRIKNKKSFFNGSVFDAQGVVVNSAFTVDKVKRFLGFHKNKIIVLNPGLDDAWLDIECAAPRYTKTEPFHLISIGSLIQRKGFDKTIEAVSILTLKGYDLLYSLVGKGDQTYLQSIARQYNVLDKITFHGFADLSEVQKFLMQSHLFVMPSRTLNQGRDVEGFGIVYLEAAACKRPSVASNDGGISDAVIDGKTGISVSNPDSAQDIATAIQSFIDDKDKLSEMGEEAYHRVNQSFRWESLCREFLVNLDRLPVA